MVLIVVDTNLMVAGRWRRNSYSNRILDLCIDGVVEAVYTDSIREENLFILGKVRPPKEFMEKIDEFYRKSRLVEPKTRVIVCRDNSDNKYLEAAAAGNADFIISSDVHLLELGEYNGVRIMKPGKFMRMLDY